VNHRKLTDGDAQMAVVKDIFWGNPGADIYVCEGPEIER
jgi:hypothetical protein